MRCLLFILLVLSFEAEAAERNADNVPNPHVGERGFIIQSTPVWAWILLIVFGIPIFFCGCCCICCWCRLCCRLWCKRPGPINGGDEGEGQPRRNSPLNVMEIFSNMFSDDRTMINSFFPIRDGGRDGEENQPINDENGRQGGGGLYPLQEMKDRPAGGSGNK
uniref:Uncharacterized protein n=1 Tax=Caenorhabditis japonica TaxID=281687 RepID=A0A8R1EPY7_CAEJA